jgi:8-oxo-dGTP pyrophosphatase MutT (NUDIX family)
VAIPDFVVALRARVGTDLLWLTGVTAVVLRDGPTTGEREVLLVQRGDNFEWTAVTGVLDPGEEPGVAACREVLEEAGVVAVARRLAWVHALPPMQYDNGDRAQYLDLTFACGYLSGEPVPDGDETVSAMWCPLTELPTMGEDMLRRIRSAADTDGPARFET